MKSVAEMGDFWGSIDTTSVGITIADEEVAYSAFVVNSMFTLGEFAGQIVIEEACFTLQKAVSPSWGESRGTHQFQACRQSPRQVDICLSGRVYGSDQFGLACTHIVRRRRAGAAKGNLGGIHWCFQPLYFSLSPSSRSRLQEGNSPGESHD